MVADGTRLKRRRLIDQHDGDVVADRIFQCAGVTNENGLVLAMFQRPLASGTDQDGKQLSGERHDAESSGRTKPKRLSE